jgi:glutaredoxin-like protein NrdH
MLEKYATKVSGTKKKNIFMFTLSTCVWCMKTKKLMKDLGYEYSYVDVDLAEGEEEVMKEFMKWSRSQSFPTIVVDNKRTIIGYQEDKIKEI